MSGRVRTREWSGVDYYRELGITSSASRAAVDEAYRRQAKAIHPDRNPEATAEDRFKRLTAAYEVLRDPVSRRAYDDFRYRVDSGLLYTSVGAPVPPAADGWAEARPAARPRKVRRPMPTGVRVTVGWLLIVTGVAAILWALLGDLPSHSVGDTVLGVQITLGIMAAKLIACGVVVIKYPELRARWHREPAAPSAQAPAGDRPVISGYRAT